MQGPHGTGDYLEAIYELIEEGVRVQQIRIADRLGVSRATVSEQVSKLTRAGLVAVDQREITLTAAGHAEAEDAVRKHRMAERFLIDVLKLPWHKAHEEATALQAGMSDEIVRHMQTLLAGPGTCPHGNPIPGTGAKIADDLQTLNSFGPGAMVVLERLTEDVELNSEAMLYFEQSGLMPGGIIEVVDVSPDGTMSLLVGEARSSLGSTLTDNLWVRPTA